MRELLELIEASPLELDERELADALWLASHLDPAPPPKPVKDETESEVEGEKPPGDTELDSLAAREADRERSPSRVSQPPAGAGSASEREPAEAEASIEGGVTVRLPRAPALPGAAAIQRALRPFKRRVASRLESVLDEEATVARFAETGVLAPLLRSARERWLEVALVVDEYESMVVWQDTVEELAGVLVRLGGFRDVRLWGLGSDGGAVWISRRVRIARGDGGGERRPPRELVDPTGRRLVLVVSDCIAPAWRLGAMASAFETWARSGPAAIVQVLPSRQWERTGLGTMRAVTLSARVPGVPNQLLTARDARATLRPPGFEAPAESGGLVPVFSLEEGSVGRWATLVAGRGSAPGRRFVAVEGAAAVRAAAADERDAEALVADFQRDATPTAKRLAGFLAAAPLQLPIMRMVQRAMLPESRQSHLAEVLLSGLVRRVSPAGAPPDEIEYEFRDRKIRDLLLDHSLRHETVRVVEEVSAWLARQRGVSTGFLTALGGQAASTGADDEPYARLTAEVLRRLGGEMGEVAERIDSIREGGGSAATDAQVPPGESDADRQPVSRGTPKDAPAEPGQERVDSRIIDWSGFIESVTREFIGRDDLYKRIGAFMNETDRGVVQIVGPSGWGKTAIIAEWVRRTGSAHYFFGASGGVDLHDHLIAQLIRQYTLTERSELARELVASDRAWEAQDLRQLLEETARDSPIAIAVDGPGGTGASQLPVSDLPRGVTLLYTGPAALKTGEPNLVIELDEDEQRQAIEQFLGTGLEGIIERMRPLLEGEPSFLYAALYASMASSDRVPPFEGEPPRTPDDLLEIAWRSLEVEFPDLRAVFGPALGLVSPEDGAQKTREAYDAAADLGLALRWQKSEGGSELRVGTTRYAWRHELIRASLERHISGSASSEPAPSITRRRALLVHYSDPETPEEYYPVQAEQQELQRALESGGFEVESLLGDTASSEHLSGALERWNRTSSPRDLLWLHLSGPGKLVDGRSEYVFSGGERESAGVRELVRPLLESGASALVLTVEGGDKEYMSQIAVGPGRSRISLLQLASERRVRDAARDLASHAVIEVLSEAAQSPPAGGLTLEELGRRVESFSSELAQREGGRAPIEKWSYGRPGLVVADFSGQASGGAVEAPPSEARVFVSYARDDEEIARFMVGSLRDQGIEAWSDRDLEVGDAWAERIKEALMDCEVFIALISQAAVSSVSNRREWSTVEQRLAASGGESPSVIPVVVGGYRPAQGELPDYLETRMWFELDEPTPDKLTELGTRVEELLGEPQSSAAPDDGRMTSWSGQPVVISYPRKDTEVARALRRTLRDRGVDFWVAGENLEPDPSARAEIDRALDGCDVYLPMLSRTAVDSEWLRRDWARVEQRLETSDRSPYVIPVIIDEAQPSVERLPRFIGERNWFRLLGQGPDKLVELIETELSNRLDVQTQAAASGPAQLEARPAFEIFAPPRGECQLLHTGSQDDPRLLLLDGGGPGSYKTTLRPRIDELRAELGLGDGEPLPIHLAILSHMDDPQSRGLLDLLEDQMIRAREGEPPLVLIREFWFNGRHDVETAEQGDQLVRERHLRELLNGLGIPLNGPFDEGPTMDWQRGPQVLTEGELALWVLAPSRKVLERARTRPDGDPNLVAMAVLLEVAGRTLLLPSDAPGDHVLEGLDHHGLLDDSGRIHVDLLKLPHHGSRKSAEAEFYERVTADAYLITGEGRHGLPDIEVLETIAQIRSSDPVTLYFSPSPDDYDKSYPSKKLRGFLKQAQSSHPALRVIEARVEQRSLVVGFGDSRPASDTVEA